MLGSKFKLRLGTRSWSLNWQLSLTACQPGHSNNRLLGTGIRERLKLKSVNSIQGRAMGTESGCSGGRHPNCCLSEQLYSFPFRKKDIIGKTFFFLRRTFCCLHFVKCSCFLTNKKWQIWAKSDPESVFSPDVYCVLYIQYPCNIICKTWWVNCKTDSGEPVLRAGAIKVNFRPNPPPAPPPALPIQLQEYKIWYVGTFPHLSKHLNI